MKEIFYIVFQNNNVSSTNINRTAQENQFCLWIYSQKLYKPSRNSTPISESQWLFQHFLGHKQLVLQNQKSLIFQEIFQYKRLTCCNCSWLKDSEKRKANEEQVKVTDSYHQLLKNTNSLDYSQICSVRGKKTASQEQAFSKRILSHKSQWYKAPKLQEEMQLIILRS